MPGYSVALALEMVLERPNERLLIPGSFNDPVPGRDVESFDVLGFDRYLSDLGMCKFDWLQGWQIESLSYCFGSCGEGVFIPRVSFPHLNIEIAVVRQTLIIGVDLGEVGELGGNAACVTETLRTATLRVNLKGLENTRELNDCSMGAVEFS